MQKEEFMILRRNFHVGIRCNLSTNYNNVLAHPTIETFKIQTLVI